MAGNDHFSMQLLSNSLRTNRLLAGVRVHFPTKVACGGFVHGGSHGRKVGGDVMFETVFADIPQQLLEPRNFNDSGTTKGLKRIVREPAAAGVAANSAATVVGRKAREAHGAGLHLPHARSKGIVLPNGTR